MTDWTALIRRCGLFTVMAGAVMVLPPAWADTIRLKNGNTLTGTVVSADDRQIIVDIDGVGRLMLEPNEVLSIDAGAEASPETPETGTSRERLWEKLHTRVEALMKLEKLEEALLVAKQASDLAQQIFGPEDIRTSDSLTSVGEIYLAQSQYGKAEKSYRQALGIAEAVHGKDSPEIAQALLNLGLVKRKQNRYAEAESTYKRVLELLEPVSGSHQKMLGMCHDHLGLLYLAQKRYTEAETHHRHAVDIFEALTPREPEPLANAFAGLATSLYYQERLTESAAAFEQAIRLAKEVFGPSHPTVQKIEADYRKVLAMLRKRETEPSTGDPGKSGELGNRLALAARRSKEGRHQEAIGLAKEAVEIAASATPPNPEYDLAALAVLVHVYEQAQRYGNAEEAQRRMIRITEEHFGLHTPRLIPLLDNLAVILRKQGKTLEPEQLEKRAARLRQNS